MNRVSIPFIIIMVIGLSSCAAARAQAAPDQLTQASSSVAAQIESTQSPTAQWPDISKLIEELVKHYYPKANFVGSKDSIHFDYKVKEESGYYGDQLVPQAGGISGDIVVKDGAPPDGGAVPQERKEGATPNTTLSIDLYSHKCQSHLVSRLTYPTNNSPEFKNKFLEIVNTFKDLAPAAATRDSAATAATATPAKTESAAETGTLLAERKKIREMIQQVSQKGKNVSNYVAALGYIEQRANAGARPEELQNTVEQLMGQLDDEINGVIHPPVTIQPVGTPSSTTDKPAGNSGKSAAQQYIEEHEREQHRLESEYKKGKSKDFWQKFHDEMSKPKPH